MKTNRVDLLNGKTISTRLGANGARKMGKKLSLAKFLAIAFLICSNSASEAKPAAAPEPEPSQLTPLTLELLSLDETMGVISAGCATTNWNVTFTQFPSAQLYTSPAADGYVELLLSSATVQAKPGYEFVGWAFDRSSLGNAYPTILQSTSIVDGTTKYGGHQFFLAKENFYTNISGTVHTLYDGGSGGPCTDLAIASGVNMPSGWSPGDALTDTYYAVFEKGQEPPSTSVVSAAQRYPWANKIDVSYTGENLTSASYTLRFKLTHDSAEKLIDTGTIVTPVDGAVSGTYTIDLETQAAEFLNLSKTSIGLVVDLLPNE